MSIFKLHIIGAALFLLLFSCDRIAKKGKGIVDQAKSTASYKADDLEDKISAKFDADTPDTRFNQKRFIEFFKFAPPADVKNLYCYADMLGIDAKFQFSFTCDTSTLNKIILAERLTKVQPSDNYTFSSILDPREFSWWSNKQLESRLPFFRNEGDQVYTYLWYDTSARKAYYFTYDM